MEIRILKNLFALDAENNFVYILEFRHEGTVIKRDQVFVPANEMRLPMEDCCGPLTKGALDANLEQLKYEYDFDINQVSITSETISAPQ